MARKPLPVEPYIDKLTQALMLGSTYELAAKYAGISVATFERWRARAVTAAPGTPLAQLRERMQQAEAHAAIRWLTQIEAAANQGDWKAAAFKLACKWPHIYGRRAQANLELQIREMAEEVSKEIGISADAILQEARSYLRDYDRRHR
jgi:hypothetical protein